MLAAATAALAEADAVARAAAHAVALMLYVTAELQRRDAQGRVLLCWYGRRWGYF